MITRLFLLKKNSYLFQIKEIDGEGNAGLKRMTETMTMAATVEGKCLTFVVRIGK